MSTIVVRARKRTFSGRLACCADVSRPLGVGRCLAKLPLCLVPSNSKGTVYVIAYGNVCALSQYNLLAVFTSFEGYIQRVSPLLFNTEPVSLFPVSGSKQTPCSVAER